jgi:hypothetical protein
MNDAQTSRAPTDVLVQHFPKWLAYYDAHGPFRKPEQLNSHRRTIELRFRWGSAAAAIEDDNFLESLYRTLQAWGIGMRASRLKPFDDFCRILRRLGDAIANFETTTLDDPGLQIGTTAEALWSVIEKVSIVENAAVVVSATKTLHHILPDLVVPIDREYTKMFFGWHNPKFQYGQRECFVEALVVFANIAQAVHPAQYVGAGWRSSRTKVIDNAVVGLIQALKTQVRAQGSGKRRPGDDFQLG